MEFLKVRKFLILRRIDFKVNRINLIIGPQANGKSLIAKLVYFFKKIPSECIIQGIRGKWDKRKLDKSILEKFEEIFPRYIWEGSEFTVSYFINEKEISIKGRRAQKGKTSLKIEYPSELYKFYNKNKQFLAKQLAKTVPQNAEETTNPLKSPVYNEFFYKNLQNSNFSTLFYRAVFIPASRSFFANLQKAIFTFLASNIDIDPFLKKFGQTYEGAKYIYKELAIIDSEINKEILKKIHGIIKFILNGEYELDDKQDWIKQRGKKINLANASSGQQEALPMLLVLGSWPALPVKNGKIFFIEEPEAHLFPVAQMYVMALLTLLYKELKTDLFVTTHSPYILSSLNVFLQAQRVLDNNNNIQESQINEIVGVCCPVKQEDLSAYTIMNGELENIIDQEFGIIGSSVIDSVSDHFQDSLNKLISLEYGE